MLDQEECSLVEEDLPSKETALKGENYVKEKTNLPMVVKVMPVSEKSSIKEIGNESQSENVGAVAVM